MKAIETTTRPAISGNFTNAELVRHIEHEFPDLSGSLLILLKRFNDQCDPEDMGRGRKQRRRGHCVVTCPKCGMELQLEED